MVDLWSTLIHLTIRTVSGDYIKYSVNSRVLTRALLELVNGLFELNLPKHFPDWVYAISKIYFFIFLLVNVLFIQNIFVAHSIKFLFQEFSLSLLLFISGIFFFYAFFILSSWKQVYVEIVHWGSTTVFSH